MHLFDLTNRGIPIFFGRTKKQNIQETPTLMSPENLEPVNFEHHGSLEEYIKGIDNTYTEETHEKSVKNLGEFHPGYDIHHIIHKRRFPEKQPIDGFEHHFAIVHKESGEVIGKIEGEQTEKESPIMIDELLIHPKHRAKRIGVSLPEKAYHHISNSGHSLMSGRMQSHGGANLWNTLRNDDSLRGRVFLYNLKTKETIPAHGVPDEHIWSSSHFPRTSGKVKSTPDPRGDSGTGHIRFVLHPPLK